MQNRYTNHLPSHFYCRHGIDLNLSCSLCATPASLIASGDGLQAATRLRNTGGGVLLTNQSVPTGDDAGRSDAGDAAKGSK